MPKWTPRNFHFTHTLTYRMRLNNVKLAGAYLSCLPADLEPVAGPILETGFFALDTTSLQWATEAGVFNVHAKKHLTILNSEYGLMSCITRKGGNVDTLLTRYREGIDWRTQAHALCNDNRHSSRRGALEGGISANIYESIFVKLSWCVRAKEAAITSRWLMKLAAGQNGTEGTLDEKGWRRGIIDAGTTSKTGMLPPDITPDGCHAGDLQEVLEPLYSPI